VTDITIQREANLHKLAIIHNLTCEVGIGGISECLQVDLAATTSPMATIEALLLAAVKGTYEVTGFPGQQSTQKQYSDDFFRFVNEHGLADKAIIALAQPVGHPNSNLHIVEFVAGTKIPLIQAAERLAKSDDAKYAVLQMKAACGLEYQVPQATNVTRRDDKKAEITR
jgi:hypothetical protein